MKILDQLTTVWRDDDSPFLVKRGGQEVRFSEILENDQADIEEISPGKVVAIVGDFDAKTISLMLRLMDRNTIVVPLTQETQAMHEYFFETAYVDFVICAGILTKREHQNSHHLIGKLQQLGRPGLILFTTGTTGKPKAILHDLSQIIRKYYTPRPAFKTLAFLLFDHIGGFNTLFHTLFNKGLIVSPVERTINSILRCCNEFQVELLPTTPTFLRMMLISGAVPSEIPSCLKIITYGTERMDLHTLTELSKLLPHMEFRQTYGMSELGILRAKSEANASLFMRIGGEGVETKIENSVLFIRSESRMLGYLNADSPFDADNWYDTKDIVEEKEGWIRICGRTNEVVNVGGLKFVASEVENVAMEFPGVGMAKVYPRSNPLTGQHVELSVQKQGGDVLEIKELMQFLMARLPRHMVPKRISLEEIKVGHRFKKL